MINILSLFSGIGAFEKALKNIGIDYEVVNFCEIDKYASKSYCSIHNESENKNLGDITKIEIDKLPKNINLITHGSPCQDFSIAGKQAGADLGTETRSSLMWNTVEIVKHCRPNVVIWENVKNVLSDKHKHNFDKYIQILDELGYNNYYQVLNAKDYEIPQNRERIFVVSIKKEIRKGFKFPVKQELKLRLKDLLEPVVDEKYYLSDEAWQKIVAYNYKQNKRIENLDGVCRCLDTMTGGHREPKVKVLGNVNPSGNGMNGNVFDSEEISPTLTTNKGEGIKIREATKQGYAIATEGDSINLTHPNSTTRRGRVGHQVAQTLDTSCNQAVVEPTYRIRKLTPLECWRLMSFGDEDFYKAQAAGISNSQLYKQAGNSIVVKVLEEIYKKLFF